ncbi:hypothetical protein ACFCWV_20575 [Streptomyces sp. NPDC056341]|uniref:hypothetical protein n=1 Tax=Streptomyces sp. NPDC056341 TaxID=3345788 RepID=UPI0035D5BADC
MGAHTAPLELHVEATAFLASLRSRGLSPKTERAAGCLALYLHHSVERCLEWRRERFLPLSGFQQWAVTELLS